MCFLRFTGAYAFLFIFVIFLDLYNYNDFFFLLNILYIYKIILIKNIPLYIRIQIKQYKNITKKIKCLIIDHKINYLLYFKNYNICRV